MSVLAEPDSVGVLSFVTPPLEIVGVCPVTVPIVALMVAGGAGGGGVDADCMTSASVAVFVFDGGGTGGGSDATLSAVSGVGAVGKSVNGK
jgi:hypothetical protein